MKSVYTIELAKRLTKIRNDRGMTQQELGDRLGLTKSSICRYEAGEREIKMSDFFKICDIYNVDAYALLDEVRKYVYKK